ncbi:MAG: L-threonylcarbamoyladenylate synthase [Thermodesulfobacteriota bacterium]
MPRDDIAQRFVCAVDLVRSGGCLIYPTETLYALGGDGRSDRAAARVQELKGRPGDKPLPLIIGGLDMLPLVTERAGEAFLRLVNAFWPGPLSVLVPALASLPAAVKDLRGMTSVRVSPHPVAARLSREAGCPLIATSANLSGQPPACRPGELDPVLARAADLVLDEPPWPGGGAPSTVVELLEQGGGLRLKVLRLGAITEEALLRAGFLLDQGGEKS